MSQAGETFFTAVGCMDGRVHEPITIFGKKKFDAKFSDTITEAGFVGLLADDTIDTKLVSQLKFKLVDVSLGMHHSKGVIVHGHQGCAGNPVDDETHKKQIKKAARFVKSLLPYKSGIPVIPLFVIKKASKWSVEEL